MDFCGKQEALLLYFPKVLSQFRFELFNTTLYSDFFFFVKCTFGSQNEAGNTQEYFT